MPTAVPQTAIGVVCLAAVLAACTSGGTRSEPTLGAAATSSPDAANRVATCDDAGDDMEALVFPDGVFTVDQAEPLADADHLRHNEITAASVAMTEERLALTFEVAANLPEVGDSAGSQVAQVVVYVDRMEAYSVTAQRDADGAYEVQGVEIDVLGGEAPRPLSFTEQKYRIEGRRLEVHVTRGDMPLLNRGFRWQAFLMEERPVQGGARESVYDACPNLSEAETEFLTRTPRAPQAMLDKLPEGP